MVLTKDSPMSMQTLLFSQLGARVLIPSGDDDSDVRAGDCKVNDGSKWV